MSAPADSPEAAEDGARRRLTVADTYQRLDEVVLRMERLDAKLDRALALVPSVEGLEQRVRVLELAAPFETISTLARKVHELELTAARAGAALGTTSALATWGNTLLLAGLGILTYFK